MDRERPSEIEGLLKVAEGELSYLQKQREFLLDQNRALKFGKEIWTPAMQTGLTTKRLMLREIFSATMHFGVPRNITFAFFYFALFADADD